MNGIKRLLQIKASELTIRRIAKAIWVRLLYIPQLMNWYTPWGFNKQNRLKLSELNNIYKDKRCFIIASGPSLKDIDFSLLKNEITFGMNRAYLMKDQLGFLPSYLVCIDVDTQLKQFTPDYDAIDYIPTIYNWDLRKLFRKIDNRYFVKTRFSPKFLTKMPGIFGNGKSVTYTCIQLAFLLGFKEVYIIGKDHSYNTTAKVGKGVQINGNDGNHFLKGYYKSGQTYNSPDYNGEEFAYKVARKTFESYNKIIKDATISGKLDIFEKVNFVSLFAKK